MSSAHMFWQYHGCADFVQVNGVAIKELLSVEVPPMEMNEKNKLIERPVTKHRILDLCLSSKL